MTGYPELETLMDGWFHQDYEINGTTVLEVVSAYRQVTPPDLQQVLANEIRRYLSEAHDVERDFRTRFKPQVIPTEFAPTTRAFLQEIVDALQR